MRTTAFNFILISTLILTGFTSCKKDTQTPNIIVNNPQENDLYQWGDEVKIDADFSDDIALKSFKILITDNLGNTLPAFDFADSGEISGESYHYVGSFTVPNDAPEKAFIRFFVEDAEDKLSELEYSILTEE